MADLRERKKMDDSEKHLSGRETTNNTEPNDIRTSTPNTDSASSQLESWNSLTYWYSMQSYYHYYYSTCYFYTYYYSQLLASQNTHTRAPGTPLETTQSRPQSGYHGHFEQLGPQGNEARVSSLQRRILAEVIDFFFLYFTKFLMFSIFYNNMERYTQLQYSLIIDENTNLKDLEEILIQALVYRFMVFAYETFFIVGGFYGNFGGATPGKYLVGVTVLAAETVELLELDERGEKLRITPGGNPGWWRACVRALVKNFSMTFLFPVFLTVFFFKHNRTIYDIIAGTVVVDKETRPTVRQRQQ